MQTRCSEDKGKVPINLMLNYMKDQLDKIRIDSLGYKRNSFQEDSTTSYLAEAPVLRQLVKRD